MQKDFIYFCRVKILIIRFSSIGDIVLTTPVVRCLKNQLSKDVEIHYLTKQGYREILEASPYISKVYTIEKSVREVVPSLRKESYDYIIDLHKNFRSFEVKSRLKAKSFSFNKLNAQKWMLVNFKMDILPKQHIVDRYMDTLKEFKVVNDGKGLDYFIPEDQIYPISKLPVSHQKSFVAFVIGANHATKRLPLAKMLEVCRKINFPLVLLGGTADMGLAKDLEDKLDEKIHNLAGKLSLHESASVLREAECVLTFDTGLMHIAAAFNKKIISIWGNTVPEFGMSPYLEENSHNSASIFEVKDLKCRPCSKIGFEKCPKGHFYCMNLQDSDEIVAEVFHKMKKD